MKTSKKLRVGIAATFTVLILISVLAIADAILLLQMADDREQSFTLLACLLFGSAASALVTLALLFLNKPWVMKTYSIFAMFWAASTISWDANIAVLSVSTTERMAGLVLAITVPILLGFGLLRYVLSVRSMAGSLTSHSSGTR